MQGRESQAAHDLRSIFKSLSFYHLADLLNGKYLTVKNIRHIFEQACFLSVHRLFYRRSMEEIRRIVGVLCLASFLALTLIMLCVSPSCFSLIAPPRSIYPNARKLIFYFQFFLLNFVQLPLEYFIPSIYYTIYLSPSIFLPLLNNLKGILPVIVIDSHFRFSSV